MMENPTELVKLAEAINQSLETYADKDWNYSRIRLLVNDLAVIVSPYVLACERLNTRSAHGQAELKTLAGEIKWGSRHSDELGILELISLRLNKALLEVTSDANWNSRRPVIRVVHRQALEQENIPSALWYEVTEVAGEEFDSR